MQFALHRWQLSNGGAQITGARARTIPDEFVLQITRDDGALMRAMREIG
jgi:hypothetical protein